IRADAHVFLPRCMCLYLDIWTTGVRDIGDGILILEFVRYFKHCFVKAVEIFNEERGASAPVCHLLQRMPAMAADGSVRMWQPDGIDQRISGTLQKRECSLQRLPALGILAVAQDHQHPFVAFFV